MATLNAQADEPTTAPAQGLLAFFGRFKEHARWAVLIALVNFVGIAYGFYYYLEQFTLTPVWLWPFVPDSPLAVLWAQLALLGYWALPHHRRGKDTPRWLDALDGLAWVGNAQVGLWTVYVLLVYADNFGTYTLNLNTILLAGHAAMVLLGAIFLWGLRQRVQAQPRRLAWALVPALLYYGVNDALDYFGPDHVGRGCGLRPMTVPCDLGLEPLLAGVTIALTLASVLALALVVRAKQ